MSDPFKVVRDFEAAIAEYCGSKFAVSCTSCTSALMLSCAWFKASGSDVKTIEIPRFTYVGVGMAIKLAGFGISFRGEEWLGSYQLRPLPIVDSARLLTSGMHRDGQMECISMHWAKHLAVQQGGVVLHDDEDADKWLRKARFDGRSEGVHPRDDTFNVLGWHVYLAPETAAAALVRLALLPKHNKPLPNSDYADLSQMEIFR